MPPLPLSSALYGSSDCRIPRFEGLPAQSFTLPHRLMGFGLRPVVRARTSKSIRVGLKTPN